MPIYEYTCKTCEVILQKFRKIDDYDEDALCPECGEPLGRRFSFSTKRSSFDPHYNSAVGKYVETKRELNDSLRSLEEESFNRIGYAPNYQFVDPADIADTVTEEGMDATNRQKVASKQLEVRKWL